MGKFNIQELKELQSNIRNKRAQGKVALSSESEESTKQKYVLKLLTLLGYDITADDEIVPEYDASLQGLKKGDKLDYIIKIDGKPIAIIECKKISVELNRDHVSQLFRYYATQSVHIAILTNGDDYWFFTDRDKMNVMDAIPYMRIRLSSATDEALKLFEQYTKSNIANTYIPHLGNIKALEDAENAKKLNHNKEELDRANKLIAELTKKVKLTEEQQRDLDAAKDRTIQLLKEKEDLQQQINSIKAFKKQVNKKSDISITYNNAFDRQRVPSDVAKAMVALLPERLFNKDTKFFDYCCRYGEFLVAIIDRLMASDAMIRSFPDEDDRIDYIRQYQLYALMPDKKGFSAVTKAVYKTLNVRKNNIIAFNSFEEYTLAIKLYRSFIRADGDILVTDSLGKELLEQLKEYLTMQFDVVVSNPPYNNDMYIDFVELGDKISKDCGVYITPAKWQAKGGDKNKWFRENIVPYMSKIVYYPVSTDIFNIGESAGISYYIITKNRQYNKELKIICEGQKIISTDDKFIYSDVKALVNEKIRTIINKCTTMDNSLGNKLNLHQSYYVKNTDSGHGRINDDDVEIYGGKAGGEKDKTGKQFFLLGYKTRSELLKLDNIDKYKACLSCMPTGNNKYGAFDESGMAYGLKEVLMLKPNQVPKGSYFPLMCFDTEDEVKSFISYFNTRFIRFLIICSIVGTTISTELFRFVPDPSSFDHIFTDEELYKKYGLTTEEINIIESVIKERK